ncbi:hypothetical protein BDP27DRAFT_1374123 [Rhodocollybia butyracea]|uniref:Uncharacterized protein n=1 Tax=Rhodocollybia butyracea TaxID=206335 RepID=A0A9P5P732_9AGAR|nr:hypothetical protein BDP27DRAFT_1374123 [Rhodocollybia butyracea]
MTCWLDRREKVLWFTRFLDWVVETDDIDWIGIQEDECSKEGAVNRDSIGEHLGEEKKVLTRANLQYGESTYNTAKHPLLSNIDIGTLDSEYRCNNFVYAMERFLHEHGLLKLDYWDATPAKYQLYKHIHIVLPSTPEISDHPVMDLCRATAAQPVAVSGKTRWKPAPAQFNTVLARKELPESRSEGLDVLGPNGLHVAQVRAIFELPEELSTFPHPLAYVEWFTPLQKLDKDTLMYQVEHSEKNNIHSASIIPVTYISRSCHLIPFSGNCTDGKWTGKNILNECKSFHLNLYLRPIDFVLLRT